MCTPGAGRLMCNPGAGRRIDIRYIRQFCFGALRWTPETTMREASLADISDAMAGYHRVWRPEPEKSGKAFLGAGFLEKMINKYPDVQEKT